jgi:CheY-like chemotaxis protein
MAAIMVVDDEPEIVTLLRFVLEADGHAVGSAVHGADALDKLGVEPARADASLPDLIVLDIMMPVMDGYQLNMRLQARRCATCSRWPRTSPPTSRSRSTRRCCAN